MRIGLELWARRAGARLLLEDDGSDPRTAVRHHAALAERCRFVLGAYGSDSTRALARSRRDGVVWNHGAAADDVQRLPGVVSVPSPASRYLVALARVVGELLPGATVALVIDRGPFARFAREGLEREAPALGLARTSAFGLGDRPEAIAATAPAAVFACGALEREVALFRELVPLLPHALFGGVSPGLQSFPELYGRDPEGLLAPVQWHPDLRARPDFGPTSAQVTADARGRVDYVAAQAYAAALIAEHCLELDPDDPLAAARRLRASTFFGAFELAASGLQIGHELAVIRWRGGRQEVVATP